MTQKRLNHTALLQVDKEASIALDAEAPLVPVIRDIGVSQSIANRDLEFIMDESPPVPIKYSQTIRFAGLDDEVCQVVSCSDVTIIPSAGTHESGSSKLKFNNVVDFCWDMQFYTGQLLAVHVTNNYLAYGIQAVSKNNGAVRVMNRKNNVRALLKGMQGMVQDIAFAHIPHQVVLASVDDFGNLFVHEVTDSEIGTLTCTLLLHVENTSNSMSPRASHRVIWCPYIPEEDSDTLLQNNVAKLLVLIHGSRAELWNVGMVNRKHGVGPLHPDEVEEGFLEINEHEQDIVDASFSPDGTALATASLDGYVKFFQVYMHNENTPRCLHQWQPHGGKPLASLFFLDNHKTHIPDAQFWKFAVTGAESNSELKIWSCESWSCLQTIRFSPDMGGTGVTMKAGLDLAAGFLLLTDMFRKVLYVMQIQKEDTTAYVSSVIEFLLPCSMLSFGVVDASIRKFKSCESFSLEDVCEDGVDDPDCVDAVVVTLYLVQPKSLQDCHIVYQVAQQNADNQLLGSLSQASLRKIKLRKIQGKLKLEKVQEKIKLREIQVKLKRDDSREDKTEEGSREDKTEEDSRLKRDDSREDKTEEDTREAKTGGDSIEAKTGEGSREDKTEEDSRVAKTGGDSSEAKTGEGSREDKTGEGSREAKTGEGSREDKSGEIDLSIPDTRGESNHLNGDLPANHLPDALQPANRNAQQQQHLNLMTPDAFSSPAKKDSPADLRSPKALQALFEYQQTPNTVLRYPMVHSLTYVNVKLATGLTNSDSSPHISRHSSSPSFHSDASAHISRLPPSPNLIMTTATPIEDVLALTGTQTEVNQPQSSSEIREVTGFQREGCASGGSSPSREVQEILSLNQNFYSSNKDLSEDCVVKQEVVQPNPEPVDNHQSEHLLKEKDIGMKPAGPQTDGWPQIPLILANEVRKKSLGLPEDGALAGGDIDRFHGLLKSNQNLETSFSDVQNQLTFLISIVQDQHAHIKSLQEDVKCLQMSMEQAPDTTSRLEVMLSAHLGAALTQQQERNTALVTELLVSKDDKERKRQEALMSHISQAVGNLVAAKLDEIVVSEMNDNILPTVRSIMDPLKHELHAELTQKLTSTDHLLKENIAKLVHSKSVMDVLSDSMVTALRPAMHGAYKDIFSALVVPSFEKTCQNMFHQINDTFTRGTKECQVKVLKLHISSEPMEGWRRSEPLYHSLGIP
uniref:Enhancer of mRNA-decapping protein 4 WD40 repeat region domain-containing protein n=1 Tax=Timema bartmani TaxID=61472 RepID=A0A7R9ESG9_9NEOP|nr:unnamed protein product [Timema bartmani]